MVIEKFLNNNMLLVTKDGQEMIAMGKGLRFSYKVGDTLDEKDCEKVYVLQDQTKKNYIEVLEQAPIEYIELCQEAISYAQAKFPTPLNEQIFVTLLDHLLYAVERYHKGIVLQNRMLWEIQKFYPNEFMIGCDIVEMINKKLDIFLPEAEAGNIAFHFVNAQIESKDNKLSSENGILMVKMLKDEKSVNQ